MKVGIITSSLSRGGAERVASIVGNYLVEQGHEVKVYLIKANKITYPMNPQVECIDLCPKSNHKIIAILQRLWDLRRQIKDDVIISMPLFYGMFSTFGKKTRLIVSERNDPANEFKGRLLAFTMRKLEYLYADQVVFQTEYARHYFGGKIESSGVVIPNPISNMLSQPYKGERSKRIVGVGRLTSQKNFALLIQSFAIVHKKYPEYELCIFGQGNALGKLQQLCEKLCIQDCVRFEGFVEDIIERIKDASVYVLSSNFEGISNAMLEALCMGIPTVCTDCGGGCARQFIIDGENGFLVPIKDAKIMADRIIRILENQDIMDRFSENAVRLRDELSVERIGKQWERLLK